MVDKWDGCVGCSPSDAILNYCNNEHDNKIMGINSVLFVEYTMKCVIIGNI